MNKNNLDFIGDVHGHSEKLKMLLYKMGYDDRGGYFKHPERSVVFVGDYIDRGPDNLGAVQIVRMMVKNGTAKALMGNHEYNAIMFNMKGENGYLRPHSIKNFNQHKATLLQHLGNQELYDDTIEWFKTLPLYLETKTFRAMHACWDSTSTDYLKKHTNAGVLNEKQLAESAVPHSDMFNAVEIVSKGLEVKLPKGDSFLDKDGTEREDIRVKWWEDPKGKTYKQMSVLQNIEMKEKNFDAALNYYKPEDVPVFFGHYWMQGEPKLQKSNVCCLDFSVAKGGYLVAYRWNGERVLSEDGFVYV